MTQLLQRWSSGHAEAFERLMPLVYDELRSLASSFLRHERAGHTLQATALVHEAYCRLTRHTRATVRDRAHFFSIAAQAMRRILVDHARRHQAEKRIDPGDKVPLDEQTPAEAPDVDVLALHEALNDLGEINQRQAKVVELRYFGGLTNDEAAIALGVSRATVERDWHVARIWLRRRVSS